MVDVMKFRSFLILFLSLLLFPSVVLATKGCCSSHGGVAGCSSSGKQICNDGSLSPSCTCTPTVTYVYGCTDKDANNYNSSANKDDGSCTYYKYGCTDVEASNYDESAERDDGSCTYYKYGCTDSKALNYDIEANKEDGSCKYVTATFDEEKLDDEEIIGDNDDNDSSGSTFLGLLVLGASGYGGYKLVKKIKKKVKD